MDSDDVMMPSRLERQLAFMSEHPDVSVATSYAYLIDTRGRTVGRSEPVIAMQKGIRISEPRCFVELIHPACIMRKADVLAVGGYNAQYRFAEDRDLWGRLATCGYRLDVQPEYLLRQRLHGGSLTLSGMRSNELTCRFIDENIVRRFKGQPEVGLAGFMEARNRRPLVRRLRSFLEDTGGILYKKATRDYAERRWMPLLCDGAGAIALQPSCALRMLRKSRLSFHTSSPDPEALSMARPFSKYENG